MLSLQSSVSNRLADTEDSQVVAANYQRDVQTAAYLTTQNASTPECDAGGTPLGASFGKGTQLLGLESNLDATTHLYDTVISYQSVKNTTSGTPVYSLVRIECQNGNLTTPTGIQTVSYDLAVSQGVPTISCVESASNCSQTLANTGWIPTQQVANVSFAIKQPKTNDAYTLVATPQDSTSASISGNPINNPTSLTLHPV